MNEAIVMTFISKAKDALSEMAADSMTYPKAEPFDHGVSCGRYQGIQQALDILDNIIRGDQEEDAKL